jgi:hypothetical protein
MLFAPTGMDALLDEILRFGKMQKDDIVDALAYILDIGVFPQPGQGQQAVIDTKPKTEEDYEREFFESFGKEEKTNLLGESIYD